MAGLEFSSEMAVMGSLLLAWLVCGAAWFLLKYRKTLTHAWAEPMLRIPVLLIESDDWGPPGKEQVAALEKLAGVLRSVRDKQGRPAQMTLAMVLAAPRPGVAPDNWDDDAVTLADSDYRPLVEALRYLKDCFSPQLHGWMHCWPSAVSRAARNDAAIADAAGRVWREGYAVLPSHLQTRWADCHKLPCQILQGEKIRQAAAREARLFRQYLPLAAPVAVPPTFVWNADVEHGWAAEGVQILITPGLRQATRDARGKPVAETERLANAQILSSGLKVLVRDIYFEPSLGHCPDEIVHKIQRQWREARPALLETHRFNFEGRGQGHSLECLGYLLQEVREHEPDVEFLRPVEIMACLENAALCYRGRTRMKIWVRRVWGQWSLRKGLLLSGFVFWLGLAWLMSLGTERHEKK